MNLKQYADERRASSKYIPNSGIMERWVDRVERLHLEEMGEEGAREYLKLYGKSIGYPKCIMLARYAETRGAYEMANGFWKKAYSIELQQDPPQETVSIVSSRVEMVMMDVDLNESVNDFPENYQPGKLVTMQPTDAQREREFYIQDDRYHGQPKRDGNKLIVFATPLKVWYQSRQLKVSEDAPSNQIDVAFRSVATHSGSFVLEGELYFLDVFGREHMTGATAAAANAKLGQPNVMPKPVFSAFGCLLVGNKAVETKGEQVFIGNEFMADLMKVCPDGFSVLPLASTTEEKQVLADEQKANGREGEVWFRADLPHRPGKITSAKDPYFDGYVRTKYSVGIQRYRITKVAPSRADGHAIGGFSIQDTDGNDVGTVGTGYTREEQVKIAELFNSNPDNAWVLVDAQTKTVYGKLRHARFVGFVNEKEM